MTSVKTTGARLSKRGNTIRQGRQKAGFLSHHLSLI